jgi:hypothetical protein
MLKALQAGLGMTDNEHLGALDRLGVLDTDDVRRYAGALSTALADGVLDPSEEAVLESLRRNYGISLMVHRALVTRLMRTG